MSHLVKLIDTILNSFLSGIMDRGISSLGQRIRTFRFIKKINTWVREYINSHDGSVLTTGAFENFLRNYHPLEKMFSLAVSTDETVKPKKQFIDEYVSIFFSSCARASQNTPENRSEVAYFLTQFYDIIDYFYRSTLNDRDRILLSNLLSSKNEIIENNNDIANKLGNSIDELKQLLKNQEPINEVEIIRSLYYKVSGYIWEGKGEDVEFLLPLIKDKNKDLELCIKFLLNVMKDKATKNEFDKLQEMVVDNELCADVVRKMIYLSTILGNKEMLSSVSDRNIDLFRIAQSVLQGEYQSIFAVSLEVNDGVTYYNFEIQKKNYPTEEWLIVRVCLLKAFEKNTSNTVEFAENLLGDTTGFLDKALIYQRKAQMIESSLYSSEEVDKVYSELNEDINKISFLPKEILCMLYSTLFKISFFISTDEPANVFRKLPESVLDNDQIKMLSMQLKIGTGEANFEEIIKISRKTGEYWLLNNYLKSIVDIEPQKAVSIVEENKFLLHDDVGFFILYVQIVERLHGVEQSLPLFEEYESIYDGVLEFWVVKFAIQGRNGISFVDELDKVYAKWRDNSIHSSFMDFELDFIDMLLRYERFDEALDFIDRREKFFGAKQEFTKRKGAALLGKKREIDALNVYLTLFNKGECSDEIIDKIMVISINNNRDVPAEVFEKAQNITSSRFLMLSAIYNGRMGHENEAGTLLLKSLLTNHGENNEVFNKYIAFHCRKVKSSEPKMDMVDAGTCVVLQSVRDGYSKKICIHKQRVLPDDIYEWGNATHIYKEKSIQLGIFRKKEKDSVIIEGEEYVIAELLPLDAFFFRTCMEKLVENGEMKALTIPVDENGDIKHDEFTNNLKELIGDDKDRDWISDYKDLSSVPATIYMYKRFVRITYTQLISTFIEDPSIIFRENQTEAPSLGNEYVLTASALVALYKIGFFPTREDITVVIPNTLHRTICDETEQIVQENNREIAAGIGIRSGQLYIIESSEDEKMKNMDEAVELKEYCAKFLRAENYNDLQLQLPEKIQIKDVLGISDYDALLIAKDHKAILVASEPMTSMVGSFDGINVTTIGIVDFLLALDIDPIEMLSYVKKIMQYKFQVPITSSLVKYIMYAHNSADPDTKERILENWDELMELAISDPIYKSWLSELFIAISSKLVNTIDEYNPIWLSFMFCTLRCKGLGVKVYFDENGKITSRIVKEK